MTYRDEIIEAMAHELSAKMRVPATPEWYKSAAKAALDATLAKLETPSEEMVEAGDSVAVRPFIAAGTFCSETFRAMLQPIIARGNP